MKEIKTITVVLAIILVCLISFVGVYAKKANQVVNQVAGYQLGMNIKGKRVVAIKLNEGTKTVIKDAEGNEVQDVTDEEIEEKGYTKEEIAINKEEDKTEANYEKVKKIIEGRLEDAGADDYLVRLDKTTGKVHIAIPENSKTDIIIDSLTTVGKFELRDTQTQEVLLDNSKIKDCKVGYVNQTVGNAIVLNINFNKEGRQKLEEISKTYIQTTDDQGATAEKNVTLKIDDNEILTTYFSNPVTEGVLQLTMGQATTDQETLQSTAISAGSVAMVLNNGNMPLSYELASNEYIASAITKQDIGLAVGIVGIVFLIALIYMGVRYHKMGVLMAIAEAGLIAVFLLVIRYANVLLTIEGGFAIAFVIALSYILSWNMIKKIKENSQDHKIDVDKMKLAMNETMTRFFLAIVPICIAAIVFCFMHWTPLASFGMTMFWGLLVMAVYHLTITKMLLYIQVKD